MRRFILWGILLAALSLAAGCSVIAKVAFGINEIKEYREDKVQSFLAESQRKVPCRQIVATVEQQDNLIRLDHDTTMMQHRAQPVQVLYFDGDSLVFYHINCYTQSGSNPLHYDWNNKGSFIHFPPSPTVVPDWRGSMTLTEYSRCLPGLNTNSRYTVLICGAICCAKSPPRRLRPLRPILMDIMTAQCGWSTPTTGLWTI